MLAVAKKFLVDYRSDRRFEETVVDACGLAEGRRSWHRSGSAEVVRI
jgi:hypothetical protein